MSEMKQGNEGEKLFAGKFKTVEELESGYNSAAKIFQENEQLKQKVEEVTKVPDDYQTPKDVAMDESELAGIKKIAKNSNLTQAQYEKLVLQTHSIKQDQAQSFETAKKEVGADNLNLIQDFIKTQYGEKISDVLIKKVIVDKELRAEIMKQRTDALNTSVPGVSRTTTGYREITQKDIDDQRNALYKASGGKNQERERERYLAMLSRRAQQNKS